MKFLKKNSKNFEIFNLGIHPFADTFISKKNLKKSEPTFPLKCLLNKQSGAIFNKVITSDKDRYNLYQYSYTSSNSQYAKSYWENYSNFFEKKFKKKGVVLEVGSNDGFLLNKIRKLGNIVYGCDASNFMCKIARKNNLNVFNYIFNFNNSLKLKKKIGSVDYVLANNVLNHANDPDNFIKGVSKILNKDGYFIFEQPYWMSMMKTQRFDQIYHEHISYFTLKYAKWILNQNGMFISDFYFTPYHGGSIRIISKKNNNISKNEKIHKAIKQEVNFGLFNQKFYKKLNFKLSKRKKNLLKKIIYYKNKNYLVIGVGAAAKANTFLCYLNLNNSLIDFITDASKFKIGKYTPKTRIPIFGDEKIKKINKKIVVILLSWNISKLLKNKLLRLNKKIKFIKY